MMITCPNCVSSEGIRKILYGMPDEEPDLTKYLVGGCIFDSNSPTHECINCGWQRFKNRFVYDEEDASGLIILKNDQPLL
jgi:hypothetical protein